MSLRPEPDRARFPSDAGFSIRAPVAITGHNCWRRRHADRVSFLIDSAAYFDAFYQAALRARHSIFIVGWDIDSRTELRPGSGLPADRLGRFLSRLVRSRRGLQVFVLGWDFPLLFAGEREFWPTLNFGARMPRRVHFHLDATYPTGTSCHQKFVVLDDAMAFVGGMDLTTRRWDTSEHRVNDPRRVDPRGRAYPPLHDAMMAVDGDAAASLAEIARERWAKATGRAPRARTGGGDPWPPQLVPDVTHLDVAIARTKPACGGDEPVREVEALFLDTIASARRRLYIENQFFTAGAIGDAIERRLVEPDGPEVVVVTSREAMSWLEETTMGVLRGRLVRRLQQADRYGRFRIYCPVIRARGPRERDGDGDGPDARGLRDRAGEGPPPRSPRDGAVVLQELAGGAAMIEHSGEIGIKVHSKILIADDRLIRIGSANVNNRSLAQDPELDLQIETEDDPRVERAVKNFRDRLLGEHLGIDPLVFGGTVEVTGSLIESIEVLRGNTHTLEPLPDLIPEWLEQVVPDEDIVDPGQPMKPQELIDRLLPPQAKEPAARRAWAALGGLLAVVLALTLLWRFTPLSAWLEPSRLAATIAPFRDGPMGPLLVVSGFVTGGLLAVPVNLLILATALAFGPVVGLGYSILGFLASASVTYWAGRHLGRSTVQHVVGRRLNRITRAIDRRSILAMTVLRLIPVAPYTLVNLVAGASRVRFSKYLVGTFLGMMPGTLAISLFGHQLGHAVREPTPLRIAAIVCLAILLVLASWGVGRFLARTRGTERPTT